jgi:outer membrane receptor protein involved in Fe transport
MRTLYYIVCVTSLLVLSLDLAAQEPALGTVTGRVFVQGTNKPLENASVVLFNASDSAIVSGGMTSSEGEFSIERIKDGTYYVVASSVGYKSSSSNTFDIDAQHRKRELGAIRLLESAVNLNSTIVVTGEEPTGVNSIDRKVYNVQKDVTAQSGSASQLLQNIPSVTVDIDGNVSLRGAGNVLILIDGRPSPLMNKNQADILQQRPANSIERVEVITNPSAKYKPDGTSGIINLVLKKDRRKGFGGAISANGGIDSRYNSNVSFNYNPGKFNLFGSCGLRKDHRNRKSMDSRQYYYAGPDTSSYYAEADTTSERPLSYLATLGVDYNLDHANRFGLSGNLFHRKFKRTEILKTLVRNNESVLSDDYERSRFDKEFQREDEATAYFEHTFGKEDHTARIEYNISDQPENEDNHYTNTYLFPALSQSYDNSLIKQGERQSQLSVEYSNPEFAQSELEAGYIHEQRKDDFDYYISYFDTLRQEFVADNLKTNHFVYDQRAEALYGTLKRTVGGFGVMVGMRYEYVHNDANLLTTDTAFAIKYSSFYPSVHLAYQLDKNSELQLNYSKRTNRPDGEELNPFQEYRDPLNIRVGNPHLLPEYIHSVEFGWQTRHGELTVTPSVYYRYRYNGFTSVSQVVQDSILLTTQMNLAHDQSAGIELVVDGSIGSVVTANASTNLFYNRIDASNIGFSSNKSVVSWSGAFNFNVNVKRGLILQVNSNYQSARLTPQGQFQPSFVLNLGGKYNLRNDKLSVVLTVSDILKTRRQKLEVRTVDINRDVNGTRDGRIVYAGLFYHLGMSQKKSKEKLLEYDSNN